MKEIVLVGRDENHQFHWDESLHQIPCLFI